ncbi:hypothetical protein ACOME3_009488 [Neoechinorhynchus agilis]
MVLRASFRLHINRKIPIKFTLEIAGGAASAAEGRKIRKYLHLSRANYFVPFGVETYGALGTLSAPGSLEEIERGQNISLAVQRGNAASMMATVEEGQKLEFGGRW